MLSCVGNCRQISSCLQYIAPYHELKTHQEVIYKLLNVLFNDALNTFYLRLYGVRNKVKDNSDNEKGNPLQPHGLLFPISSKGYFVCIIPQTG